MKVLTQHMHDYIEDRSPEACNAFRASLMTPCQARDMHKSLQCHAAVRDVDQCMWGEQQVRPDTCIDVPSDHHEHVHNDLAPSSKKSSKVCKIDMIYGKHPCEREIKGTCTSLRFGISKMSHKDRHKHFGHCGYCKDCKVCKMVAGVARRIYLCIRRLTLIVSYALVIPGSWTF